MRRKAGYILMLLLLGGVLAAYWMYARKEPDAVQLQPDFKLSAAELTAAFTQDATAASRRYNGKVVRVWGTVKNVGEAGAVVLEGGAAASEIVIGLDQRRRQDAQLLKPGTNATLQGVFSGYEQGSGAADDLLASLGTTVQLRSGGVVKSE